MGGLLSAWETPILAAGWAAFGIGLLALLLWSGTCLREGEGRALAISAAGGGALMAVFAALLLIDQPLRPPLVAAVVGAGALCLFFFCLPLGRSRAGLQTVGPRPRVDERDAVFHRFYRLREGTPEFDAYYGAHPELCESDSRLRKKPDLGAPGSRHFHPLDSAYQHALADVTALLSADAARRRTGLSTAPPTASPEEFSRRVAGLARHLGADLVGFSPLDPADVYSHVGRGAGEWGAAIDLPHPHAVVVGVAMDWRLVRHAPGTATTTETMVCYQRAATIALSLARTIERWTYRARAHVDGNYQVLCGPLAERAGLGETARNGLLIVPGHGPRVRLAVVTTDLPLAVHRGGAPHLGVQAFCANCRKCADNCPSGAVDAGEQAVHLGVRKWQTDRDRCYRHWRHLGTDCALCIKVCPYAKPGSFMHRLVRWFIAQNALARRLALSADDLLYGRRPAIRYQDSSWHGGLGRG